MSRAILLIAGLSHAFSLAAQESDTTVTYPANYFSQWNPVTVADMIDRIPGISITLEDNSSRFQQNNRGLGSTERILINGRRLSGKDNDAAAQLSRISFDQVSHIEIIRGTSSDLVGVRNEGQIINIVTSSTSEMSVTATSSLTRYQDSHVEPSASITVNGNTDRLDYRIGLESSSNYQVNEIIEESVHGLGDYSPNDLRSITEITDQIDLAFNSNLSYQITPQQTLTLNLLYEETDPPRSLERDITDFNFQPAQLFREVEDIASTRDNWEIGADYNQVFPDGSRLQFISINNQSDQESLRSRFRLSSDASLQDLSLRNNTYNSERIYRVAYTKPLVTGHDVEVGLERAQTTLETELELARLLPGTGLTPIPIPNAKSTIEEIRYEGFVVHHWQLNPRMKLESQLLYEVSEISQTGDVNRSRDFDFIRPKVDYRFDITPSLQLQLSVEKFVAQLRFNDFAANAEVRDEDRDTIAGNPELRQQQSWRYTANLEYRFLEDRGVINARAWYWDVSDAIDRIDVSQPGGPLESANGNIGDGSVTAIQLNSSFRISPNLLLSGTVLARASEIRDPFTGVERRLVPNDRGFYSFALRHDLPEVNLNYGLDYRGASQGNRPLYDINRIDDLGQREDLSVFVERNSIGSLGLVARFDVINILNKGMCNDRFRYPGRISEVPFNEVERRCVERGTQLVFQLRGTF